MQFGTVLKDVRAHKGLSQAALAQSLGSTQRHVSFVETGRSRPTAYFVARICQELSLSLAQKAQLYTAAGLPAPFAQRARTSDEVAAALDLIHTRVLTPWPFPALVMDEDWNVLRRNGPFEALFAPLLPQGNAAANLLDIMLSDIFRSLVVNWEEASTAFYFRLQAAAGRSAHVAQLFAKTRSTGLFDGVEARLTNTETLPVFVPIRIALPGGPTIELSSLMGKLASVQDALIDGFEIELMVPTDDMSAQIMQGR